MKRRLNPQRSSFLGTVFLTLNDGANSALAAFLHAFKRRHECNKRASPQAQSP